MCIRDSCRSAHPFAPHKRYNAYLAASEPVYAYDGDLARFCGAAGSVTKLDASAYEMCIRDRLGFVLAKPIISKLGIKKTVYFGVLGQAITCAARCVVPTNFMAFTVTSLIEMCIRDRHWLFFHVNRRRICRGFCQMMNSSEDIF